MMFALKNIYIYSAHKINVNVTHQTNLIWNTKATTDQTT
jgi:hypothetical protein